ncbi:MAG TPA: DUF4369 domain-containing protein [Puia sp.]|jgi:peroxiredoxin
MKKALIYIILFIFFKSPYIVAQVDKGFSINGHIEGLENGERGILNLVASNTDIKTTDSCFVKDGSFHLEGRVPEGPRLYWLFFNSKLHPSHGAKVIILFIDNNDAISIHGTDINKMPNGVIQGFLTIEGSTSNRDFDRLFNVVKYFRPVQEATARDLDQIKDYSTDRVRTAEILKFKYRLIRSLKFLFEDNFVRDNTSVANYLTVSSGFKDEHFNFLPEVYNRMTQHLKESFYGKRLKELATLSIGQTFPEFTLPTSDGKYLASNEIISKSKITIVQFWAFNSEDVDNSQKDLLDIYNEYHSKGLNIIGISSDTSIKKWKVALQDLPWYHCSDLKGRNGVVETVYHEYGDPGRPHTTNVIIDQTGKIIAWGIKGVELKYIIAQQFGILSN